MTARDAVLPIILLQNGRTRILFYFVAIIVFATTFVFMLESRMNGGTSPDFFELWTQKTFSMENNVSRGYLLAANIEQQMTQAVMCYGHLASLASLLNLSSVQPYVYGTSLITLPDPSTHPSDLSTLFDLTSFRNNMRTCSPRNDHEMSTFVDFVRTASRDVILVYFLSDVGWYYRLTYFTEGETIVEVSNNFRWTTPKALTKLNNWASRVTKERRLGATIPFRVVRTILVDATPKQAIHTNYLREKINSAVRRQVAKGGSATVLIDSWRGIHHNRKSSYFYYIPDFPLHCRNPNEIELNRLVVKASRDFEKSLDTGEKIRIGVHIRGEKIFKRYSQFEKCFDQVSNLLKDIISNRDDAVVYVFHDLGKYGTRSCSYWRCGRKRNRFLAEVKKLGHRVVYFDPAKFPSAPSNPAFGSFVEREFLSRVDKLVTVGFGSYQWSIVQRFLRQSNHTVRDTHRFCT